MAVSKILNMKDCKGNFHGKHLKASLDYIMNPEKTQNGRLIGSLNCQVDTAFEQMKETKRQFGKIDGRQGYHIILSLPEGEGTPDMMFELAQKFVKEYLGKQYEAVYVVHDNTDHIHSHIVFNSVSFVDGKKYRYEKGDWAKYIQPITNRLCEEYGLSVLDIEEESRDGKRKSSEHYKEWNELRDGSFVWSDMIKRDLDACILQATDYDGFLELLSAKGYEIKQGKHLAVKPQGMQRFRRCDTLGEEYAAESIQKRILKEDMEFYRRQNVKPVAKIVTCRIKRYRRAKLSGLQKKYYAKLYRTGQLKKRPYSQAWKYRNDIKKMKQLQEEYLFLSRHDIHSAEELVATVSNLTDKRKEANREKSRIYRAKQKCKQLFDTADEMKELQAAHKAYKSGDDFFAEEEEKWVELEKFLRQEGYSYEEVTDLQEYYKKNIAETTQKVSVVTKELRIGEGILKDIISSGTKREQDIELEREAEKKQKEESKEDKKRQPSR